MGKLKKIIVIVILLLNMSIIYAQEPANITIILDEEVLNLVDPPYIINGRTLLPMRYLFELLEYEVSWVHETRTAIGMKGDTIIELPIGSSIAKVNGEDVVIDVPSMIINDRTYIPARFVAEATGALVTWDNDTRTVNIDTEIELTIDELLINIYNESNKDEIDTEKIRESYLSIKNKLFSIQEENQSDKERFKSGIIELADSINFELDNSISLGEMLILFNEELKKDTESKILDIKFKYEPYSYDGGDIGYNMHGDSEIGLYEFISGTQIISEFNLNKRNGYTTSIYDSYYNYSLFYDDNSEGYKFSYQKDSDSELFIIDYQSESERDGNSYQIRISDDGYLLYEKYSTYKDGIPIGLSEINFSDGIKRFDINNEIGNNVLATIGYDDYFIFPTDDQGFPENSRTGYGYKEFDSKIEYIGEFIKGYKTGDGMYYGSEELSLAEENLMIQRIDEIIEKIIKDGMSEEEKVKTVYDYLGQHIDYDKDIDEYGEYSSVSHTGYGAIVLGIGVCDGYSEAFKYVLDELDIKSVVVVGKGSDNLEEEMEAHAWNLVELDGEYYHFDLTWDDDDYYKIIHYTYFKKSSDYFNDTHEWLEEDYVQ